MDAVGYNTPAGQRLSTIIERIEKAEADKAEVGDYIKAIYAEAKADGYDPKAIRRRIRRRKMAPNIIQEMDAIDDLYAHALGEAIETPLHTHVSMMSVDITARAEVIESLKKLVPANGAITVEAGGRPVRLVRDERGEVHEVEIEELKPASVRPPPSARGAERAPPPDVDDDGAEALGAAAFAANVPIVLNPFPYGDARRGRWDAGWRHASGGDGMGPGEKG